MITQKQVTRKSKAKAVKGAAEIRLSEEKVTEAMEMASMRAETSLFAWSNGLPHSYIADPRMWGNRTARPQFKNFSPGLIVALRQLDRLLGELGQIERGLYQVIVTSAVLQIIKRLNRRTARKAEKRVPPPRLRR